MNIIRETAARLAELESWLNINKVTFLEGIKVVKCVYPSSIKSLVWYPNKFSIYHARLSS